MNQQQQRSRFITDLWLRDVGFKPHLIESPPSKHWLLWLSDDLGIELSFGREKPQPWWFCWLRTSGSHTPERFINLRDLSSKHEVIVLVQSLTGQRWNPSTHFNGSMSRQRRIGGK